MVKALTSDELGAVGEQEFGRLCAQAQLVCNGSERDRTGWDFIVEFPMADAGPGLSLDQRGATAAHVQLKTTAIAAPVSLRLSAAERLAKDVRPAFIVVFRMTPDGASLSGHLIHLLGAPLARVLKRLRTAHASQNFDVNRAKISFDYRKLGQAFPLTAEGLLTALAEACGDDPAAYTSEKQRQLEQLGYENGGLEAEAVFWVDSAEQLGDMLVGLQPIRPERLTVFDTRFGIRLPYTGELLGDLQEFHVDLPRLGNGTVAIRPSGLKPAAIFDVEILVGPPTPDDLDYPWLVVRNPDFALTFRAASLNFETTGTFTSKPRDLETWARLVRGLTYLADGRSALTLTTPDLLPLSFPVGGPLDGPYLDQLPALSRFLDGWRQLLAIAGVTAFDSFSMDDIWAAKSVGLAIDIMLGRPPTAWFAFDGEAVGDPAEDIEAVYVDTCELGGVAISYSAGVTLHRNAAKPSEFRSNAFTPLDVRPAVADLEDYAEEQAERHGVKVLINPANLIHVPLEEEGEA